MPYINQENRKPFQEVIEKVTSIISQQGDQLRQMEFASFFAYEVVKGFMGTLVTPHSTFNSLQFEKKQKYDVSLAASEAVRIITRQHTDLLTQSGEIHYVLAGVCWGALGQHEQIAEARYGQRAFLRGAMSKICSELDHAGNVRQQLVLRGVMDDVVDETYRRLTAKYEDEKCQENGDVWPLTVDL